MNLVKNCGKLLLFYPANDSVNFFLDFHLDLRMQNHLKKAIAQCFAGSFGSGNEKVLKINAKSNDFKSRILMIYLTVDDEILVGEELAPLGVLLYQELVDVAPLVIGVEADPLVMNDPLDHDPELVHRFPNPPINALERGNFFQERSCSDGTGCCLLKKLCSILANFQN